LARSLENQKSGSISGNRRILWEAFGVPFCFPKTILRTKGSPKMDHAIISEQPESQEDVINQWNKAGLTAISDPCRVKAKTPPNKSVLWLESPTISGRVNPFESVSIHFSPKKC
jgi:hypothetical protein